MWSICCWRPVPIRPALTNIATPLHHALRGNHLHVANRLIEAGAPERVLGPSIEALISDADTAHGKQIARGCEICHGVPSDDRATGTTAPNLWAIYGQPAASDPEFDYSVHLKNAELTWDAETLNHYLYSPYQFLPGTSKIMFGITSDPDRAALIAYLATLTD